MTRPNVVVGTLDYASPEQLGNAAPGRPPERPVQPRLHDLLRPRRPPPFEGGDVVNKIFKQRMDDPEPLERVARGVPAGVRRGRPQADGQGPRRPLPGLRRAPGRPGPLGRPRRRPLDPRRRGRRRPGLPPPPARDRRRRPAPPRPDDGSPSSLRSATSARPRPPPAPMQRSPRRPPARAGPPRTVRSRSGERPWTSRGGWSGSSPGPWSGVLVIVVIARSGSCRS